MFNVNPILDTDSYKFSHFNQLPPDTTNVYSYIESRGGRFDRTLFFGLQIWLKNLRPITIADVNEAEQLCKLHGEPFNREGFERIVNVHGGNWPVRICAIPEGTVIPTNNTLVTVENIDPALPWVTAFIETAILRAVWYPTTVATVSWHAKQIIRAALEKSSDDPAGQISFKLHDFGARGVSSRESAAIGGAAHLVNFLGSDTVSGVVAANQYYNTTISGFSIPAMEHSTVTIWGRTNEEQAFGNMLTNYAKPGALVACVSDSYDLWNAVNNIWGDTLRQRVLDSGATIVVRPDSGDCLTVPRQVIAGLADKYGSTVNTKGYRVLNPAVRVIQGDGITIDSLPVIINNVLEEGWSLDNLAFGMGGGLLQQVNRDTLRFAMKTSSAVVGGQQIDVRKDPITDLGKRSKKGRFIVTRERGKWETLPEQAGWDWADTLVPVWEQGMLLRDYTFDHVRERSNWDPLD